MNKGNVGSKNMLKKTTNATQLKKNSSVKIITAKSNKELGSSYNKTSGVSTNKYIKSARGVKKSEVSNSKILEQSSNQINNSSKLSPSGYTPRSGINANTLNTKSYNTLMTIMQNKEQEYASIAGGIYSGGGIKANSSSSRLLNSPQIKCIELESSIKHYPDPKVLKQSDVQIIPCQKIVKRDLEDYIKTKKSSRNMYQNDSSSLTQNKSYKYT